MAYRITTHKARTTKDGTAFSARHLDRHFDLKKAKHIDPARTHLNRYVEFHVGEDGTLHHKKSKHLQMHELAVYRKLFQKRLDTMNKRYIAQRHPEKCKTLEQYYRSPQSCPDEYLIYIGDTDNNPGADVLKAAGSELIRRLQKKYSKNFIPLCVATHLDEQGAAHLHLRGIFISTTDKNGVKVSITKGMKEAGIALPDAEKPEHKYNNRQMAFSEEIRNTFADICEQEFGLEIEREARDSSRAGKDLVTYQRDQALQELQEIKNECSKTQTQRVLEAQKHEELVEQVAVLTKRKAGLEAALERLKKVFLPIHKLFTKLASIRIGNRTVLDEVLLDSELSSSYGALKELESELR